MSLKTSPVTIGSILLQFLVHIYCSDTVTSFIPSRTASCVPRAFYEKNNQSTYCNRIYGTKSSLSSVPYGSGMDQNDMMEKDMLIAVNSDDKIIPNAQMSKKKAHQFNPDQPRGIAHRAFSVFLFNADNKMLLTRRATTKITFPGVWTNTCCSHPLHGQEPNEVDDVDVAFPSFPGIKHAAIRKLNHELGISADDVPHEDFRFLTRFHYWAADTVTYGKDAPWGEHEIDYVLFIKCEKEPTVNANEEEVDDHKYVSIVELKDMMYNDDSLLWSPWFKGIMERGGFELWENIDEAMEADSKWINEDITFFDPPVEHSADYNLPEHGKDTGVLDLEPGVRA